MTLPLPSEVEGVLLETARRPGKTPEQLAAETLRSNFSPAVVYPMARQVFRFSGFQLRVSGCGWR